MAEKLKAAPVGPNGLVMAYMGSVHAAKSRMGQGDQAFLPAAADLPPERTISVYINDNGGAAWNCMQDGCAPHSMRARNATRGFASPDALPWRYDWVFELGGKVSASPPAVPAG